MKILFLHISDAHFKENTQLSEINSTAIVDTLVQLGHVDECIILFSGDIAFSGQLSQFLIAEKFIGRLVKNIKSRLIRNKNIRVFVTPGNHDVLMADENRNNMDIEEYYKDGTEENKFYEDLEQLSNFYSFSKDNNCFCKYKVIDVRKVEYESFIIKINLINSTPFSLMKGDNRDKGLHYIPEKELQKLDMDIGQKYTLSVIHHGPEWFSDRSKQGLYNKINNSTDLFLVGHEHFSLNEDKDVNGNHIDISSGVALSGTETEHGLNAFILDTTAHSLKGYKCVYNGEIYKPTNILNNSDVIFHSTKFIFTKEFRNFLLTDSNQHEGDNYINYFVFPSLEVRDANAGFRDSTITSEDQFIELFKSKPKISIEGSTRMGKTTLAKYLCNKLSEEYIPLFLSEENFSVRNIQSILKHALQDEYGEQADVDEYFQLRQNIKILIIDGIDKIEKSKWETFYEMYGSQFNNIVVFTGIDWNINIRDRVIEELTEKPFYYMRICPFYYLKREQLIRKICTNYLKINSLPNLDEKVKKINNDITNQIKYFQLTPDFIHQFVDYYIEFSYIRTQQETNVFSKVFEANITYRISKNVKEESDINEIFIALDFVAHFMHFCKKSQIITYEEFEKSINEYKEKYDNKELDIRYVYDVSVKANIIKEVAGGFNLEFCDKNLLAYFVAQHLNRICQTNSNSIELQFVLDNICFGINGDVILFLSYITSNTQILGPVLKSIITHMDSWQELNFDIDNIGFISKASINISTSIPDDKDKQKISEKKNQMEEEIIQQQKNDADSLYSYDETKINTFSNKISKSINYLDLVAKILPNFRHILTKDEKDNIIKILYTYPNKLLYFMLKDIDENYKKIIDEFLKNEPRTKKGLLITEDMVSKELQNQSMVYILSVYDFISTTASNRKTICNYVMYAQQPSKPHKHCISGL
jgi:hypothetical protein